MQEKYKRLVNYMPEIKKCEIEDYLLGIPIHIFSSTVHTHF